MAAACRRRHAGRGAVPLDGAACRVAPRGLGESRDPREAIGALDAGWSRVAGAFPRSGGRALGQAGASIVSRQMDIFPFQTNGLRIGLVRPNGAAEIV